MNELVISDTFWGLAKWGVYIFLLIYLAFSFVIVKQVRLMVQTLEVGFEKQLIIVAYIYVALSFFVLLLSIVVL